MAVFCSSLTSWFPGMLLTYFLIIIIIIIIIIKLMTQILANRISPWLTSILHPSQHCGIHDHSIFEAIATVREAIACTEYTRTSMCVLYIDFKDAFVNISHGYLFQILVICGFSKQVQRYIRQIMGKQHRQSISMITGRGSIPLTAECCKDVL